MSPPLCGAVFCVCDQRSQSKQGVLIADPAAITLTEQTLKAELACAGL